jgi:hypothetical protein
MVELKETVELMNSSDYKDRFKAEYYQLKIRYDKLHTMCEKWDKGELDFTPTCPRTLYARQLNAMVFYLKVLEERAKIEQVKL